MKRFGDTLRQLMELKAVTGVQLSAETGLTTTSISRLLNGQTRPRQVTLTRLMKYLCETKAEEQSLLRAYSGLDTLPEEAVLDDEKNAQEEIARVKRFLEVKTQSILFKKSVARELDKAGIKYGMDYCEGALSTDFMIETEGRRIAVECRFNVLRDMERAVLTANFLEEELSCESVITVIPFSNESEPSIPLVPLSDLTDTLKGLLS